MKKINSSQFEEAVLQDPAWASKLTEPVEITDFCDMGNSKITHLSPLLHFTGKDKAGWSADFALCKSLTIAEGKFSGFAYFSDSGVEKIGDLTCGKDNYGKSAYFANCTSLKIAEGRFNGSVNFDYSHIEKIGDLTCSPNSRGFRLNVRDCHNLKSIPISFIPKEVDADEHLLKKLVKDRILETFKKNLAVEPIWL